jgi:hypothetical protein
MINPFHKPFVDDFHPEMDLVLHREAFMFTFTCFPHLSSSGLSGMVYELLPNCLSLMTLLVVLIIFFGDMRAHRL